MAISTRSGQQADGDVFPAPVYRDTVLEQVFADAKRYFLEPLLQVEYAHTVMLERQGILPRPDAIKCLWALEELDLPALRASKYDGRHEDLFFLVEARLAESAGAEVAGKMHTARSRNDIDLTMYRMVLRQLLLETMSALLKLRQCLVDLAWEHRSALMPAYTHNQPAQPTTLGHYLMAHVEVLERDAERVRASYERTNRSPLGACAITTTGFPIDRSYTAALLGFDGLQMNSYGAIAAVDYLTEGCSVLAVAMISLGRFAQDMLLWSTVEFNYLRLSDAFVQISSIMPQKRNPVPLEHVRILASRALTQAQSVQGCLHNTPFADMNDAEDDLQPLAYSAFTDGLRALLLLEGALGSATFQTQRMAAAANDHFLTVTELADTLVRETGTSFHAAHGLVSSAVRELTDRGLGYDPDALTTLIERDLSQVIGRKDAVSRERLRDSLRARHFVEIRTIPGGPAASALDPEIVRARAQVEQDAAWIATTKNSLEAARGRLREATQGLLQDGNVDHAGSWQEPAPYGRP